MNIGGIAKVFKKDIFIFFKICIVRIISAPILQKIFTPKIYLKVCYLIEMGKKLDLRNPQTFNEKLQWLKLYDNNPFYTQLVDKYEVREYISKTIGSEYLIPLLGVYDNVEEIDFNELPNQFVLKCTHDSGELIICKDKSEIDIKTIKKRLTKCLKRNYYYYGREWPYKNVKPRIICEKYMEEQSGGSLKDYKFMCFNGEVRCLFVCLNRNTETGLNVDFYDLEWNPLPFERHYRKSGISLPKPKTFDKMINISQILSKDKPFVRVDFYEIKGQLYFGELTFFPGSGYEEFTPLKYDYLLGSWLQLPLKHKSIIES